MKKAFLFLACMFVAFTANAQQQSPRSVAHVQTASSKLGDVNGDGVVDINDIVMMVTHIMGEQNSDIQKKNADINADGTITIMDVMLDVRIILGNTDGMFDKFLVVQFPDGQMQPIHMEDVGSLVAVDDTYDFTILDTYDSVMLENVMKVVFRYGCEIDTSMYKIYKRPDNMTHVTATAMTQVGNPFVVADQEGNHHLVPRITFQHDGDVSSWMANGLSGDVCDLLFIARTNAELATASGDDVLEMLEELSGTDQADADAVTATLQDNPDVEEAYSTDGENVVVKMKDDDSYAACPLYSLESVFSDEGEMEILMGMSDAKKKLKAPKPSSGNEKVAIFNFFEGGFSSHGGADIKIAYANLLEEMFEDNNYQVEMYGHGFDNGGTPTFTMSKFDKVISNSSEYSAIIIMSHGYATKDGECYFATCEHYEKGMSYPTKQTVIIDNNRFVAHSSKMSLPPNCLLYLGSCYGIPESGYGYANTPVIGWKGKNAVSQMHAGVFFHKLLYGDAKVSVDNAWLSTFHSDPFNPSTQLYKSPSVNNWDFAYGKEVQPEYVESMTLRIGSGKDIFVKKSTKPSKLEFSGYIKGKADKYFPFVRVKLVPIVRIQNPGEYSFNVPPRHSDMLSELAEGDGYYFEDSYTMDDEFLEGIYRINVYVQTPSGWKLIIQPEPVYVIYSSKFDDNYALPEISAEDAYAPSILGSDGQPVEEITIPAGSTQTYQLDAYSGHTFDTPCLDTNVATVSLSGSTLTVKGVSEGSTYFGVFDRQNHQMAVVQVTVTPGGTPQAYLTCPDDHHPHLIDLGLPSGTKWACCNVGADKPEAYGGYYAWGETEEKSYYDWNTYIHCDGSFSTFHDLGSDIAGTQYDVAHVKWGGSWVMPSRDQNKELIENCNHEWTTVNGVNGRKFTSKTNGGSIFLPAAGRRWIDDLNYGGSDGYYWSSTQYPSYSYDAYNLYFDLDYAYCHYNCRYGGFSVRPISR